MYTDRNFKTKKALTEALRLHSLGCHQPGPFGPEVKDGEHCCEGPHYPEPHRWYATVRVKAGYIVAIKAGKKWVEPGCFCPDLTKKNEPLPCGWCLAARKEVLSR